MMPSTIGKADCWDNAMAESFFATLENELLATGCSRAAQRCDARSPATSRTTITTRDDTRILTTSARSNTGWLPRKHSNLSTELGQLQFSTLAIAVDQMHCYNSPSLILFSCCFPKSSPVARPAQIAARWMQQSPWA